MSNTPLPAEEGGRDICACGHSKMSHQVTPSSTPRECWHVEDHATGRVAGGNNVCACLKYTPGSVVSSEEGGCVKPCPFCGAAATVMPLESEDTTGENGGAPYYTWWRIGCESCGASHMGANSERAAVAAWNRRTSPSLTETLNNGQKESREGR